MIRGFDASRQVQNGTLVPSPPGSISISVLSEALSLSSSLVVVSDGVRPPQSFLHPHSFLGHHEFLLLVPCIAPPRINFTRHSRTRLPLQAVYLLSFGKTGAGPWRYLLQSSGRWRLVGRYRVSPFFSPFRLFSHSIVNQQHPRFDLLGQCKSPARLRCNSLRFTFL